MSCRRFASEYVSKHLHGLPVMAVLDAIVPSTTAPVIATHSGSFHCDEALACGLLRHTEMYQNAVIVRTRDPAVIDQCTIVVDVGAVYDASTNRFDHHQSSFHGTMTTSRREYKTRLSSAGLIYKHFGRSIIAQYVSACLASPARAELMRMTGWPESCTGLSEADLDVLYDTIYKSFVEQVDGIDNGVEPYAPKDSADAAAFPLVKNYSQTTTLSDRVGKLQPWWNDAQNGEAAADNAAFVEAVEMTSREFFEAVSFYAFSWLPARSIVVEAFNAAAEVHPSGQIVVFKSKSGPWKDHLVELEKEAHCEGRTLYVLFSDGKGWRVQCVPKAGSGFESRKPLPFKGLRDDDLSKASGIDGGVFVHVTGFIGGMKTYEGALALALKALEA